MIMIAKPEEDDKSTLASATATPAPDFDIDSKLGSVDSKTPFNIAEMDSKIDFKVGDDEMDLTADFDVDVSPHSISPFLHFVEVIAY